MVRLIVVLIIISSYIFSGPYEDGKKLFWDKCSMCHTGYMDAEKIKENFFDKNNTILMLGAPTENMLAYAIMHGPNHIGDPKNPKAQQLKIEEFLNSYLYNPDRSKSICDPKILSYYDIKPPPTKKLGKKDISDLAYFFMNYKKKQKKNPKAFKIKKKYNNLKIQ
jgi:Cft2 family RNA processing exonuclease